MNAEQTALSNQWTAIATEGTLSSHLDELNKHLSTLVYVTGNSPQEIDSKLVVAINSIASGWISSNELIGKYRHILRWIDLVQNTLVTESSDYQKLSLNLDVELAREIKEKPKKKGEEQKPKETKTSAPAPGPAVKGKPTDPEAIAKAKAAKEAKKAAKAKANAEAQAKAAAAAALPPSPSLIDLRVGFIEKAVKHPDADSLYVSTIQMGDEDGPRTVCSGLVKHFSLEEMQQRYVIVVANLKPVSMRGIKSCAMVLCASNDEGKVEFVNPPAGSKPGEKVFFEGYDGVPEKQLNPKKKIWEAIQPNFTTLQDFSVVYKQDGKPDAKLITKSGELCKNSTLVGAQVK